MYESIEVAPRRRSRALPLALAIFGVAAIFGGGVAIGVDVTRKPTAAEREKAGAGEGGVSEAHACSGWAGARVVGA
jgi:hypothetical protein